MSRKICVIVNSRANYGRIKSVLSAIEAHHDTELCLVVGASALLYRFGNVQEVIKHDGFDISSTVYSIVEGENPTTMAKSTGMGIIELATQFENLKPDIVVTVADRFETLATAVAACYMNIPVAHTQGGEVTGSIDESVRHAVTKLSHIHFPATKLAADYLVRMGEDPSTIHNTGCPSIDILNQIDLSLPENIFTSYKGVGVGIDAKKPYVVVLQHPVTTEYGEGFNQINETLAAIQNLNMQAVWLWPNIDAGSDDVSKGLRTYREKTESNKIHFYRNFAVEDYAKIINNAGCVIGNSSSAIREGAFLGIPAVNIGTRQSGREHGPNIIHTSYDHEEIYKAVKHQLTHDRYPSSNIFGDGNAGKRIVDVLSKCELNIKKQLHYTFD